MGEAVKKRLAELEVQTPVGIKLDVINFQSDDVTKAVNSFVINFIEAVAIVVVVLLIFMGLRSGLLIGTVLAITVLATMIVMSIMQINLQRISLGALIIALGMLVDNAIVVTEGILVRLEAGIERIQAAREVVAQNMLPLLGATVVAVLAFAAIGVSKDNTGEYCRSLFQVMLISLMMSWVIAITVTPLFCVMFLKVKKRFNESTANLHRGFLYTFYSRILRMSIRLRWLTVAVLVLLLLASVYGFGFLKNSFFPPSTRPGFQLHYWLPEGTDIRKTTRDISKIEEHLLEDERVTSVASYIGEGATRFMLTFSPDTSGSKSYGLLLIGVKDYRLIDTMIPELREYLNENYPDAEPKIEKYQLGPGGGYHVEARFSGPDPAVLRQLSNKAQAVMRSDPNATSIRDDWRQRVKILRPQYSDAEAKRAGVSRSVLNAALEFAFTGTRVGVYREGDKMIPIIARPPEKERVNVANINDLQVWSPITRRSVPVHQVISGIETTWEDSLIRRRDRKLTITAQCDAVFGVLGSTVFRKCA